MREHTFKHSFQDTINPLCSCGLDLESTELFILHCPQFVNERRTLLSTIGNINYKLLGNTDSNLTQTLLFGNKSFDITDNTKILTATIKFYLVVYIYKYIYIYMYTYFFSISFGIYFSLFSLDQKKFLFLRLLDHFCFFNPRHP